MQTSLDSADLSVETKEQPLVVDHATDGPQAIQGGTLTEMSLEPAPQLPPQQSPAVASTTPTGSIAAAAAAAVASPENVSGALARNRQRCGQCEGCQAEECQTCSGCARKKTYGGDHCVQRQCLNLRFRPAVSIPPIASAAAAAAKPTTSGATKKRPRTPRSTPSASSAASTGSAAPKRGENYTSETLPPPEPLFLPQPPLVEREFPWPASLLGDQSIRHKRQQAVQEIASLSSPPVHHICGLELPRKRLRVCGKCGQSNQTSDEKTGFENTILLCDGQGCGQEFHVKCCTPPLRTIPKGAFYCLDCSPKSATQHLEDYLLHHEQTKNEHEAKERRKSTSTKKTKYDPISFADQLLKNDVMEELNEKGSSVVSENKKHRTGRQRGREHYDGELQLPCSELEFVRYGNANDLIGKPVRLYCPMGNSYHNGRILDVRPCPEDTLCLVRFPEGKDSRKMALTTWIHLEEHCVAVATEAVWGLFGSKSIDRSTSRKKLAAANKKKARWMRAKLWRRTARELVPVMHLLDQEQNQICFRQSKQPIDGSAPTRKAERGHGGRWGLVETFGTGTYELLNLDFESHADPIELSRIHPLHGRQSPGDHVENPVFDGMVQVELQEEQRVRRWKDLSLENPFHNRALKSQDEMAVGPLDFQIPEQKLLVRPPSLVSTGLDRAMFLELASRQLRLPATKDLSLRMECRLAECLTASVHALTSESSRKRDIQ